MRRRIIALAAVGTLIGASGAAWLFTRQTSGAPASARAANANEQAVLDSPVLRRLLHGTPIVGFKTHSGQGCYLGLTVILNHRVDIHAGGITATDPDAQCNVRRSATYSMDATGVPSISVELDRFKHTILYIRPNWDVAGADLRSAKWEGSGLNFPPVGD
jgi:hypothetical protein